MPSPLCRHPTFMSTHYVFLKFKDMSMWFCVTYSNAYLISSLVSFCSTREKRRGSNVFTGWGPWTLQRLQGSPMFKPHPFCPQSHALVRSEAIDKWTRSVKDRKNQKRGRNAERRRLVTKELDPGRGGGELCRRLRKPLLQRPWVEGAAVRGAARRLEKGERESGSSWDQKVTGGQITWAT